MAKWMEATFAQYCPDGMANEEHQRQRSVYNVYCLISFKYARDSLIKFGIIGNLN